MAERVANSDFDWADQSHDIIDEAMRRLEAKWQSAGSADPAEFLPPASHPLRERALITLIKIDQEYRWRSDEYKNVECYLSEWPELKSKPDVLVELLEAECRARAIRRAIPLREELKKRFPKICNRVDLATIEAQAEEERWLGDGRVRSLDAPLAPTAAQSGHSPTTGTSQRLPNGRLLDRYEIRDVLGQGGMGTVYLAYDPELKRRVAIKVPHKEWFRWGDSENRVLEEARTAAALKHSAIVEVYDVGRDETQIPYMVMEYIEGPSLDMLLKSKRLSFSRVAALMAEVASAVHYAHKHQFIHRDLKPGNIMLDGEGKVHVVDFGLAIHESLQRGKAGERAGALAYMAPEQIRGETHRLDGRADIWAFGATLYEMLTGRRPFSGATTIDLADEILHREPKPPRMIDDSVPRELERICLGCLRKDPAERYTTAADLVDELREYARIEGVHSSDGRTARREARSDLPLEALLTVLRRFSGDLRDLREDVLKAVQIAAVDPEMALVRTSKVLEHMLSDVYQRWYHESPGAHTFETLLQRLVDDGRFPTKLEAYATLIQKLGNLGAHRSGERITTSDCYLSLSQLSGILEWYSEDTKRIHSPMADSQVNEVDVLGNPDTILIVAHSLLGKGKWREAAMKLEEYAKHRPNDWESHFARGVALANRRAGYETDLESLRAYNDAIVHAPETGTKRRARLFAYRGAILKRLRRLDEAQSDLTLASSYASDVDQLNDVKYNLAGVFAMRGDRDSMLTTIRSLKDAPHYLAAIRSHLDDYFSDFNDDQEFLRTIQV
jgi:serine/threonine protein kinase